MTNAKNHRPAARTRMGALLLGVMAVVGCEESAPTAVGDQNLRSTADEVTIRISQQSALAGETIRVRFDYPHAAGGDPSLHARLSWDIDAFEYSPSDHEESILVLDGGRSLGWMAFEVSERALMEAGSLSLYFKALRDADTGGFSGEADILYLR